MLISIVSITSFAQDKMVYDYKASIKRLDFVLALKTINKKQYVTQSFKTTSDTINGYIIIPICMICNDEFGVSNSMVWEGEKPVLGYFWRSGDKIGKKATVKHYSAQSGEYDGPVYYVAYDNAVKVDAAMFGAYTVGSESLKDETGGTLKGKPLTSNKYAWMQIVYNLGANGTAVSTSNLFNNKKVSPDAINYAFLGYANVNAGYVINNGFGTITSKKVTCIPGADGLIGICDDTDPIKEDTKFQTIINTISGSVCGGAQTMSRGMDFVDPLYAGPCGVTPIWDICDISPVNDAVIFGTWTLKYNKSMTDRYAADGEAAILNKIGVGADKVFDVNAGN